MKERRGRTASLHSGRSASPPHPFHVNRAPWRNPTGAALAGVVRDSSPRKGPTAENLEGGHEPAERWGNRSVLALP